MIPVLEMTLSTFNSLPGQSRLAKLEMANEPKRPVQNQKIKFPGTPMNRMIVRTTVALLALIGFTWSASTDAQDLAAAESLDVLFCEYHIDGEIDLTMKPDWIVASIVESKGKKDGKVKHVKQMRMTVVEEMDSSLQMTRRLPVKMANGDTQFLSLGTQARVQAKMAGDFVIASLDYSASDPPEKVEVESDFVPEESIDIQTTMKLEPGKRTMIGGISGNRSIIVTVTIE